MIKVQLTGPQYQTLTDPAKYRAFVAGIGSGKSFVGSHYIRGKLSSEPPEVKGLIGANTYRQLHNATLATLFKVLDDLKIPYEYNQQKGILNAAGREIYCYSLDNYNPIRGIEIGYFWLDETRDTRPEAWRVILGRHRCKKARSLDGILTTSPNGFDWIYDQFGPKNKDPNFRLIKGNSYQNKFLPDSYLDTLKLAYTEEFYQQEVMGEFISMSKGRIYRSFDRDRHVKPCRPNSKSRIYIGMDFNVNPMSAVVFQYTDKIRVLDEIYLMDSGTHEMAQEILRRYGTLPLIIPDATGKALKTASRGQSDHEILRRAGLEVASTYNPSRLDRYNSVNLLFIKDLIEIDPSCEYLIKDLEQVIYKEGTTRPDTSQPELTHISDALGYGAFYVEPLQRPARGIEILTR